MRSWHPARHGASGIAALALLLGACAGGGGTDAAPPSPAEADHDPVTRHAIALASVHRELPPPPATDPQQLTVVVAHAGGARDPGLDAAVATLRQRPDLRVVVVVADGGGAGSATTMSGDPARTVPGGIVDAVGAALDDPTTEPDLVLIGVDVAGGTDDPSTTAAARLAVARGVPALHVSAERADAVDYAAASVQLLEVLDFGLTELVESRPRALRLTVPSCRSGTLRGRIDVGAAADDSPPALASDCLAEEPLPHSGEDEAFAAGYATLAELR